MAQPADQNNSVRDILAKLDRSIDRARAERMERETGGTNDEQSPPGKPGQARPLRARPLRNPDGPAEPDPGGKWIGKAND